MPITLDAIAAKALQLTPAERNELIDRLIASLEPAHALHPEWEAEIARRVAEMEAGQGESIPAAQVFAEVRAAIEAHESKV